MKRLMAGLIMFAGILGGLLALEPQEAELSLYRTAAAAPLSGTFYRGTSLRLTNCVCYANATGTSTQDLTALTVLVTVGDATQSTQVTATVTDAADGLWTCDFTISTNSTATQNIEVELHDAATNVVYVYPWVPFVTKERL